jgi:hypothetical protein
LHIGRSNIHYTHTLHTLKGLVYCNDCGSYSQRHKLHKLAKECEPPTKFGLENLAALRACRLPRKLDHWPCEHEHAVHDALSQEALSPGESSIFDCIQGSMGSVAMPLALQLALQTSPPSDEDEPSVENAISNAGAAPSVGQPPVSCLDDPDLSMSESDSE